MIPSILSSQLIKGTKDYLSTTFPSSTPAFFGMIDKFACEDGKLFKGPYVSVALPFRKGDKSVHYFPETLSKNFKPFYHQELAFKRLGGRVAKPTLVATGTGSGKTEAFMFPMLDYCYKHRDTKGIKAIIIYPMNALATDQAKRFAKTISSTESLSGLRVGLYIGASEQHPHKTMSKDYVITDKDILRDNPPDILLTNYKMLDFMLMKPRDQKIWKHNEGTDVLKFIAVDEIHTFDGAQGTDLASLMRRLRAKLDVKKGELACVGTSATLGGDGTSAIREFASDIFSEEFDEDSVVKEHRISPEEFFEGSDDEVGSYPHSSQLKELDYGNFTSVEEYVKAQYMLWFNEEVQDVNSDEFKVELGGKLKKLYFFKLLLQTLDGGIKSREQIIDAFILKIPIKSSSEYFEYMLDSLLALTSWAKNEKMGKSYPPFLFVRVQLWLRELARMVAPLEENPQLVYSDDLKADELERHFPVMHCRDCHAMGWGGVKKSGTGELQSDLILFYRSFFSHDNRVKFIFPIDKNPKNLTGRVYYIDKHGQEMSDDDIDGCIKVYENDNINHDGKSHTNCPFCNSLNSLTILGARAASLTSVLIGQNFSSYYNDDKKLIAFSDSVQDSAQRAGFFGARSYQFTIRSAMQQALKSCGNKVTLNDFSGAIDTYWSGIFQDDKQYIATLIAPDMEWLREYDNLVKTDELSNSTELKELVNKRIDWMIHSEYGFKSHLGRTLERSGASVMGVDGLKDVVDTLLPMMQNDIEMFRDITKEMLEKFVLGFLIYLKNSGAIYSEHIMPYITSGGETYKVNQLYPRNKYMAKFSPSSRNPKFLTNGSFKAFDSISNKSKTTWCDRWLMYNFVDKNTLLPDTTSVYKPILETLLKQNIMIETGVKDKLVWGLNPQKLYITASTRELVCSECKHCLNIDITYQNTAQGMKCLRKECSGYYEDHISEDNYYKLLYANGDLQRVVAREHTGLLERAVREKVETDFIKRKPYEPWKPNILSATPTLEMGIDIGDLSSVVLCSVPPNGANYLQRIGRAGRSDGNAFNVTLANASDHDLYFYEDPSEMMQGNIDAPGIYIDASAILQRQFLAFCIDSWVSKNSITDQELPKELIKVLNSVDKYQKDRFPYTLFDFILKNSADLLKSFFNLYEEKLQDNSKKKLEKFVIGDDKSSSLVLLILHRLELILQEQKSLRVQIDKLKMILKKHEKKEAKDKDHDDVQLTMQSELDGLKSILSMLKKKKTFEFFTDEGLLPNYAFPESGVILKSIIYRQKEMKADESGGKYETYTYEYERAGSSAISELAPNNSFYAGGRKVTIDQIDMSSAEPETWIFCDKCSYTQSATSEEISSCPRCGSEMFCDAGQKKEILRMKQVLATTSDKNSRLKDDNEQRDVKFFNKQLLINFDKKHIEDAYAIVSDDVSFGFEFIGEVNFKEINFGETSLVGNDTSIAGKSVPRKGFVICRDCGKVQFSKPTDENFKPEHSFVCDIEDKFDASNYFESLYLYREFNSEAIRLMLPISSLDIDDEKLHSLIASFQLGFKGYFKGSVEHLRVGIYDEIDSVDEIPKRYLILYDTVPGGTGYLEQLMRDDKPLFEVLVVALKKLKSCECGDKDGCYRCIYAYKNNFDRPLISKKKAIEIMEHILVSRGSIEKVQSVSDVNSDSLSESLLEELFLSKLKNISFIWNDKRTSSEHGRYSFELLDKQGNKHSYEIQQQVELGDKEGVNIYSKADFVIYPTRQTSMKPIAIFTDGFAFHQDRVSIDSAQRMAIVQSTNYIVWSLTWEDVYEFNQKKPSYKYENYLDDKHININLSKKIYKENKDFLKSSNMALLVELLMDTNVDIWSKRAISISTTMIKPKPYDITDKVLTKSLSKTLYKELFDEESEYVAGVYDDEDVSIISITNRSHLQANDFSKNVFVIHLKDKFTKLSFGSWAGVLRLYNLLQFSKTSFFTTTQALENSSYDVIDFDTVEKTSTRGWQYVYKEVQQDVKSLVKKLSKHTDIPIPIVGLELDGAGGVEAELVWVDFKIAVTLEENVMLEEWSIFNTNETEKLIKTLKQRVL